MLPGKESVAHPRFLKKKGSSPSAGHNLKERGEDLLTKQREVSQRGGRYQTFSLLRERSIS